MIVHLSSSIAFFGSDQPENVADVRPLQTLSTCSGNAVATRTLPVTESTHAATMGLQLVQRQLGCGSQLPFQGRRDAGLIRDEFASER